MRFLRNNWYWIIGILIGIGVSSIILIQRHQPQTQNTQSQPLAPAAAKPLSPEAAPGEHWKSSPRSVPPAISQKVSKTQPSAKRKKGTQQRRDPKRSNIGGISWKGGASSGEYSCVYDPGFSPLPEEIENALLMLEEEKENLESLHSRLQWGESLDEALESVSMFAAVEGFNTDLLMDKGKPRPVMSDEEYEEREYKLLIGERDLEAATQFLEAHGYYSAAHLKRLDSTRAFQYLQTIETPHNFPKRGSSRAYAEQVLAENPKDLAARLYLADTAPKQSKTDVEVALGQYQEILDDYPESAHALVESGSLLVALDKPLEALANLNKGHQLGASRGYFEAAYAYQQLGDYKTAWVHLKKALQLPHGQRTPAHLRAIEAGLPIVPPLPLEQIFPSEDEGVLPDTSEPLPEKTFSGESFAEETPWPDEFLPRPPEQKEQPDARAQAAAAAKKAREEFLQHQELSHQGLNDFLQWAETIINADSPMDTNNFLMKEMEAHLKGGQPQFEPERIVRAFEIMERYGPAEGIKRLQKADAELAKQVQRLLAEKRTPNRNKKQNRK